MHETLATITAAEASIPVGGKCATLAAQVKHVAFYLDVVDKTVRAPNTPASDWGEIWRTVGAVTPEEWAAIQGELRASYNRIIALVHDTPDWDNMRTIGGAIAGHKVQQHYTQPLAGQQIIVRTSNGVLVSVTQPANPGLRQGQKVYIEGSGEDARVVVR